MGDLMKMLDGNKTNLGFLGLGLVGVLQSFGKIDPATAEKLYWAIGAWTGIAIRHAVGKVESATKGVSK
jgi:hypothetical protein